MNGALLPLGGAEPIESRQNGVPIVILAREIASSPVEVKHLAGNYTLLAADAGKILLTDSSDPVALTVPAGLPIGFQCAIVQGDDGQVTIAGSGATVSNRQSFTKTAGQYALVSLLAIAKNSFVLLGDAA